MIEFDVVVVSTEFIIVSYFKKGLKPSVKTEIDQNATQLNDYEKLVAKTVKVEAETGLWLSSYIQKTIKIASKKVNWLTLPHTRSKLKEQ